MSDQTKPIRIMCHICKHETEHNIVCRDTQEGQSRLDADVERQVPDHWSVHSDVLQCLGCREFTIRRTADDSWADYPSEEFFPPRHVEATRLPPEWTNSLPIGIASLLHEVYSAIRAGSYRLAAMGLRGLMDELMTKTLGDIGGFDEKVKKMVLEGYLSKVQKSVLDPTLELGHAATHRSHRPSASQLDAALGIVEGMLHLFCIQTQVVDQLKAGVKPRQRVKANPKSQKQVKVAGRKKTELPQGQSPSSPN